MPIEITVTPTRTEDLLTFTLNRELVPPGTGLSFPSARSAESNPVAKAIFQVQGVCGVLIHGGEINVTKDEGARWASIKSKILEAIKTACDSLPC